MTRIKNFAWSCHRKYVLSRWCKSRLLLFLEIYDNQKLSPVVIWIIGLGLPITKMVWYRINYNDIVIQFNFFYRQTTKENLEAYNNHMVGMYNVYLLGHWIQKLFSLAKYRTDVYANVHRPYLRMLVSMITLLKHNKAHPTE